MTVTANNPPTTGPHAGNGCAVTVATTRTGALSRRRAESGQVLPLIAICLTALMGFGGMSVDVGYLEYHQREQQSSADAAALGGAQQLIYSNCANSSAATTAADNDAAESGYTNGANHVTVTVQNPPTTGPYAGNGCAVTVTVTAAKVSTFFTRLFGNAFSSGATESTQATGLVRANNDGCFYALSAGSSSTFNGDNVNAGGCGFLINDTALFNGSNFDAGSIGYGGGAPTENGTTFPGATPAPMLKVADPCQEITGCAYIAANPPPATNCTSYNKSASNLTVEPGCYSSFTQNGGSNITLAPGTYVFTGSTLFNGVTNVTGSGVTLYVAAGGTPPTFNGCTNVTLSAPTTGNDAGVLYYQVPSNSGNPLFNGTGMQLSGLVYAPSATGATFNGTNGGYLVVVVGAATFNGSSAYNLASPPPNGSLIKSAVLGQ